jgi:hypothetical protein
MRVERFDMFLKKIWGGIVRIMIIVGRRGEGEIVQVGVRVGVVGRRQERRRRRERRKETTNSSKASRKSYSMPWISVSTIRKIKGRKYNHNPVSHCLLIWECIWDLGNPWTLLQHHNHTPSTLTPQT